MLIISTFNDLHDAVLQVVADWVSNTVSPVLTKWFYQVTDKFSLGVSRPL